jgi:hypothetical protein
VQKGRECGIEMQRGRYDAAVPWLVRAARARNEPAAVVGALDNLRKLAEDGHRPSVEALRACLLDLGLQLPR